MKEICLSLVGAPLLLICCVVTVAAGIDHADLVGVQTLLKAGMQVTLREASGRFEIGVIDGVSGPLGHEIVEVGADYVVVKDISGVIEMWIPVYSLACVRRTSAGP